VGLRNDKAKQLKQYSKGMLQRIAFAQALINDPRVLIFDEPTTGLDPVAHVEVRDLIETLRDQGKTVFLCSHQLSDVERVCNRICILNYGKVVKTGRVDELLAEGRTAITATSIPNETTERLRTAGADVAVNDGRVVVTCQGEEQVNEMVDFIRGAKGRIISVEPLRRRLEQIYAEAVESAGTPGRRIGTMGQLSKDDQP